MAFSDDFLAQIADKNDIAEVVSGYVRLTKRSGANQFGLCPFHNEKTGSFSVNTSKQIYYCFGCHKGGGVINFIMEVENLGYREAVEFLAKRAGIPMPEDGYEDINAKRRKRMLELNKAAAKYWHELLVSDNGRTAREYMNQRGISPKVATAFGLGCAPDSWDSLKKAMHAKGFTDLEMRDAGLAKQGQKGGWYDAFRNRLVFPVIDVRGDVIGFSGRLLSGEGAKYYNSPETLVFKKGKNLFALNLAKKSKAPYFILVEGNVDVVSLHQAGFDSAIASLGTALTQEQAKLISNYKNEVIIAYDNDSAGINAAQKAIAIFEKLDMKVRVLRMNGAKDPDEFIKKFGSAAFQNLLSDSENDMDYLLNSLFSKYNMTVLDQKLEFVKEASRLIARNHSSITREVYAGRISELSGISREAVLKEISDIRKRLERDARKRETTREMLPAVSNVGGERFSDPASAMAEAGIIRLLMLDPELIKRDDLPSEDEFTSVSYRNIYRAVTERLRSGRAPTVNSLSQELSAAESSMLIELCDKPETIAKASSTMTDYISKLRRKETGPITGDSLMQFARRRAQELKG